MNPVFVPLIMTVIAFLIPSRFDPAIRIKERQVRNGTHPESKP